MQMNLKMHMMKFYVMVFLFKKRCLVKKNRK